LPVGVVPAGEDPPFGDEQGVILASCDGFDVLELHLCWEVAVFALAAAQLPVNAVAEGYAKAVGLY
jgi:hypothetical protein